VAKQQDDDVLVASAFDRARVFAAFTGSIVAWYAAVGAGLIGLPLTTPSLILELFIAAMLGGIAVGIWRRLVPERWGHVLLGAVWWLTMFVTMQSFLLGHQGVDALLIIVEVLGIAVLLQTRFVIVSLLVYLPALVLSGIPGWRMYLAGVIGGQVVAFAFHRVFRAAMLDAELRRQAQAEAATALEHKLAEIERSRAAREALAGQIAATERIEATGTLAASFAHQMNNILTGITMTTSLLARRATPAHRADYDVILAESMRGSDLTRALLAFSRRSTTERTPHVFDEVVRTRCELITRMLPRTLQLELQLVAPVTVSCDVVQIGQLLMNLTMNAADAMDGAHGTVVVATSVEIVDGERFVRMCVRDRGRGIDIADQPRVFDPFFTTKPNGKGMGLPTAWGIVRSHDGTIQIESSVGTGTTVTVQLPVAKGLEA